MRDLSTTYDVRPARRRDLSQLAAIEDSGITLFESVLGDLTGDVLASPAPSGEERAAQDGFVLVAVNGEAETPVGFAHVRYLDGHAHLEQLSVHPDHGRQGVGTSLVEAACDRLAVHGHGSVTLLTYADLAWNAPFYARLGFAEVPQDEPRPNHHLALFTQEERLGLARHGRRVLMRRVLRRHRTTEELVAHLPVLDSAPRDVGTLRLLVRRPGWGAREVLDVGVLDVKVGLVGDNWIDRESKRTDDGLAHPDMQLNVMSHPLIEFLAQDADREALAGDQLYVDLDISHENLPEGSELHIGGAGGAVIKVTDQPHNGCGKFIARFGKEAMAFVNSPEGKPRRLRGLCARVVTPGVIRPGDTVRVDRALISPSGTVTGE